MTSNEWVPKVGEEVIVVDTWRDTVEVVASRDGVTWVALADGDVHDLSAIRPGDDLSVDEMFKAICPDETGEVIRVWRTEDGGVIVQRCLEDEPPHSGPTLDDAIRAAFEAIKNDV